MAKVLVSGTTGGMRVSGEAPDSGRPAEQVSRQALPSPPWACLVPGRAEAEALVGAKTRHRSTPKPVTSGELAEAPESGWVPSSPRRGGKTAPNGDCDRLLASHLSGVPRHYGCSLPMIS